MVFIPNNPWTQNSTKQNLQTFQHREPQKFVYKSQYTSEKIPTNSINVDLNDLKSDQISWLWAVNEIQFRFYRWVETYV